MTEDQIAASLESLAAEAQRARDLEEIKALKARYCRMVDTHDWDGWLGTCLTDDIQLVLEGHVVEGHDGVRAMIGNTLEGATTVHHVHGPEITLTGADTATGIWAMDDLVHLVLPRERRFHGHGHYHETYVRTPAGWRIARSELTRIRVDKVG
jgi:hypothetical protein